MDNHYPDFTPILELDQCRKNSTKHRVYFLTAKGWKLYSHPQNYEIAVLHAELLEKEGHSVKITYKGKIKYEKGEGR